MKFNFDICCKNKDVDLIVSVLSFQHVPFIFIYLKNYRKSSRLKHKLHKQHNLINISIFNCTIIIKIKVTVNVLI